MNTEKSNNKEPDNGLYTLLTAGQLVRLDKDFRNSSIVEVVRQTPRRIGLRLAVNGWRYGVGLPCRHFHFTTNLNGKLHYTAGYAQCFISN